MAILLQSDPATAEALRPAVGTSVEVVETMTALRRALELAPHHDLIVIGPDVDLDLALEFAGSERLSHPARGVVLIRRRVDSTVLREAMRAGVREVVPNDDLASLNDACRRSEDLSRRVRGADEDEQSGDQEAGRLVTVFAAKGGCGKTTVATNLAAALAANGKRRVCLVDLDLSFGDVAIALQLFPHRSIADAVGLTRLDESAVRSLVTSHSPGLDTIVAPAEPGTAESIPATLVGDLLQVLKQCFDLVVVDSPPAFTDHVLAAFDRTDHYVLLATLDVPALKNLKLTLETLDMLNYPRERWHVVLNRSDAKVGLSLSDVEKTLNTRIALQIPSSRAVPASINRGVPIVLDQPGHPVSEAIRKFAESAIGAGAHAAGTRRDRRGFSLLRRAEAKP